MMMQMLFAGGAMVFTDNVRAEDEDNPRGYFEHKLVAALQKESSWVAQATGKAVKVISQLLPHLPSDFSYKIIFMERPLDEVIESQRIMLARSGRSGAQLSCVALKRVFNNQLLRVGFWLAEHPNFTVLRLQYHNVLRDPLSAARSVTTFLDLKLATDKMSAVVDHRFYRQRLADGVSLDTQ
jgi:hypothetical protein